MRAFTASVLVSATPLALWGCGGDDTTAAPTTAAPAPSPPAGTVQEAWDNHFSAFATFNVTQIMLDYDDDSEIHVYNDHCFPPSEPDFAAPLGLTRYAGTEGIQTFFTNLFQQLDNELGNVNHVGPRKARNVPATDNTSGFPEVKERTGGDIATANVFLTWRTANIGNLIKFATDSFSWKFIQNRFWIDLQTIVVTEDPTEHPCTVATRATPPADTTPIAMGWANHFSAFDDRNNVTIMEDYTEESIVQLFDNRDLSYNFYKGKDRIQLMFTELFAAMAKERTNATDSGTEGLEVSLLEVEERFNSVFLAWKSKSHPKATDTFIFNGNKIIRQNIVVETIAPAPPLVQEEQLTGLVV